MRPATRRLLFWLTTFGLCAVSGAFYGAMTVGGRPGVGAFYGLCCGGAVMAFEHGLVLPGSRARLRRLPWLVGVLATEVVYLVLVMAGTVVAGLTLWITGILKEPLADAILLSPLTALYALTVSALLITMTRMRDLVGADAFRNILLGRYHEPQSEERIFLFLDLVDSTAYAQANGDLKAQAFLGAIFAELAEPVRRHGGAIDDYVGDMALVTWPLARGVRDARCVACVFDFLAIVAAGAERWRRDFGQVPTFRVALHGGSVVTAEVGVDRHKIAYFGDVVNTTGRIESLCKTLDAPLLVSSDLLDRMPRLPDGIVARGLGEHALKGRGQMLSVYALGLAAEPVPQTVLAA